MFRLALSAAVLAVLAACSNDEERRDATAAPAAPTGTETSAGEAATEPVKPGDADAKGAAGDADAATREKMLISRGALVFKMRVCHSCHAVEGESIIIGPSLVGVWGQTREMTDGSTLTFDEDYVRESLIGPRQRIRKGFNPVMPDYAGRIPDADLEALSAYIRSLSD